MWNIESFSRMLQLSMLPVVLISAASLLLLSITNRLGRTIDRSREIAQDIAADAAFIHDGGRQQLQILLKRAKWLRSCASFVALSILFSSLMIIGLFLLLFAGWPAQSMVLAFFLFSIISIVIALVFFILDIFLALKALNLAVSKYLK